MRTTANVLPAARRAPNPAGAGGSGEAAQQCGAQLLRLVAAAEAGLEAQQRGQEGRGAEVRLAPRRVAAQRGRAVAVELEEPGVR
jgi:hypothetical protein